MLRLIYYTHLQWGFQQCLPFSWTTLRGKHCRHPIAVMGVVDTFGQRHLRDWFIHIAQNMKLLEELAEACLVGVLWVLAYLIL